MIIGVTSHLPYAEFFARPAPAAAVALVLTIGLIGLLNPLEFSTSFTSAVKKPRPRWHAGQLAKGLLVTLAVIASFFVGIPIAEAALVGGSLLFLSRDVTPRKIYAGIDGGLLLMFAGLFIGVAAAEKKLLTPQLVAAVQQLHFENGWILSGVTALLSNLVSNVPAVLILKHSELAGSRPGLADRGDEFHFCRKPCFDRFSRQSHRRRTRQASRSDDLFSRLWAHWPAADAGEPLVWHLVAVVTERRKYYGIPRELVNRPRWGPIHTNPVDIVGLDEHGAFNCLSGLHGSFP
jgi:hypothetical protein